MKPFTWGPGGAQMTPEQIAAQRKVSEALMARGMDYSPIQSPWQGAARVAQAMLGGFEGYRADEADKANRTADQEMIAALLGGAASAAPQPAAPTAPASPQIGSTRAPVAVDADAENVASTPQDYINRAFGMTPQDRELATRTVLGEASNQGQTGMNAVADVMRNRAASGGYGGNSVGEVALAKGQFEPWMTQAGRQRMQGFSPEGQPYRNAQAAVDTAGVGSRPDVSGGATYFYAPKAQAQLAQTDGRPVVPSFARGREPSAVVGDHTFYGPRTQVADARQAAPQASTQAQGINPAIIRAATSPYASETTKKLGMSLLQQHLKPQEYGFTAAGDKVFRTNKRTGEATPVAGTPTAADKALDTKSGQDFAEYVAGGGYADAAKNIAEISDVVKRLNSGEALTGPTIGLQPRKILELTNPSAADTLDRVENVVQRNLRLILGAQFTQEEGNRLIARAYNPTLPPEMNAKRLNALMTQMQLAADAKEAAWKHYQENGTMKGYSGPTVSVASFRNRMEQEWAKMGGATNRPSGPPAGVDPKLWSVMTPEERAAWN